MKQRYLNWLIILLGVVVVLYCTPALAADGAKDGWSPVIGEDYEDPDITDESFGQNQQATWLGAMDFDPYDQRRSEYYNYSDRERCIYNGEPISALQAVFRLPSGARLVSARLWNFDFMATEENVLRILYHYPDDYTTQVGWVGSGVAYAGGYNFGPSVTLNHTISNASRWYSAKVSLGLGTANGDDMCLLGVRLLWQRQIRTGLSHPFTDIGGLPILWQNAIAALRASNITSGCTATQYCPNDNLTRGQMAVFLAKALGLHWAYPSY